MGGQTVPERETERKRDTDVQNRLLDSVGEGEGGIFRENSMYIIYSETDHQPRWYT